MKIAILSGKGGTGKTFVAVNLAAIVPGGVYVDCDVEEPNGHLFLRPEGLVEKDVFVPVPVVDAERCTACRTCVDFCRYNALALIGSTVKVFDDICHSCGGCTLFCPEKAMSEAGRAIGTLCHGTYKPAALNGEVGGGAQATACLHGGPEQIGPEQIGFEQAGDALGEHRQAEPTENERKSQKGVASKHMPNGLKQHPKNTQAIDGPDLRASFPSFFYGGRLNPGEASGVPLIEAVLQEVDENSSALGRSQSAVIIDCPPGSACVVMESIKDVDFCLLVAEPTVFGAHNLQMVYELVSIFKKPHAVILNKDEVTQDNPSARFCEEHAIPVVGSIPYSAEVARINARGGLAVDESADIRQLFHAVAHEIGLMERV